jgi:hypothetical protein
MLSERSLTDPEVISRLLVRHHKTQFNAGERVDFKHDWPKTWKVIGLIESDEVLLTVLADHSQQLPANSGGWKSSVNIQCMEFIPCPSYHQRSGSTAWTIQQYLNGKAQIYIGNGLGWIHEPQIEVNKATEFEHDPLMFQFLNILENYLHLREVCRVFTEGLPVWGNDGIKIVNYNNLLKAKGYVPYPEDKLYLYKNLVVS